MHRLSLHTPTAVSPSSLLLLAILAVALSLRLYGINWDSGFGFHPDERSIYMRAGCMYDVLTEAAGYQSCLREFPDMESGIPSLKTFFDAEGVWSDSRCIVILTCPEPFGGRMLKGQGKKT